MSGVGSLRESVLEAKCFIKGVLRNAREVGAPLPTSRHAARAMCEPLFRELENGTKPSVLEVGAGTGSISRFLIDALNELEHLVICECNPFYAEHLRQKIVSRSRLFSKDPSRAKVVNEYVENLAARLKSEGGASILEKKFDFIICSLPFLSFSPAKCLELLKVMSSLSHERTVMTFYEHLGFRELKKLFEQDRRAFYREIEKVTVSKKIVYRNYYPIRVICLRPYFLDFDSK